MDANVQAFLQRLAAEHRELKRQQGEILLAYKSFVRACEDAPKSITAEIDSIPGRRVFYNLVAVLPFTIAQNGLRGQPMPMQVSQDGPFIQTHYPLVLWTPNAPDTTTNFGRWRPVYTWPLPDQVVDADIIDLSWEMSDSGGQRQYQNLAVPPLFSTPDNAIPLPVPTIYSANTVIQFTPTFNAITFNSETPPTSGILVVALPGYKVANL